MSNEENIAILRAFKASINFSQNATLRSFGLLPPAHAPGWFREEFVGNFLKFFRRQKSSRAAIIFVHLCADFQLHAQCQGERLGSFECFRLIAANHSMRL